MSRLSTTICVCLVMGGALAMAVLNLATGADARLAHAMANELGLFDQVLASDGEVNLTGTRKRDRPVLEFGRRGFDYIGNDRRDLPVWAAARRGLVVNASARLRTQV